MIIYQCDVCEREERAGEHERPPRTSPVRLRLRDGSSIDLHVDVSSHASSPGETPHAWSVDLPKGLHVCGLCQFKAAIVALSGWVSAHGETEGTEGASSEA